MNEASAPKPSPSPLGSALRVRARTYLGSQRNLPSSQTRGSRCFRLGLPASSASLGMPLALEYTMVAGETMADSTQQMKPPLFLGLILLSCGCAGRDEAMPQGVDAQEDLDSGSPSPPNEGFASSIGGGFDVCSNAGPALSINLVREPEALTFFRFVGPSQCQSLDRSSLLRNTGTSPLRVLGVAFDRAVFSMPDLGLPIVVQPGEAIAVPVRFSGEQDIGSTMTVATDAGCRAFEMAGVAAEDGLFDFSAAALDFGSVPIGGVSEPLKFTFQVQLGEALTANNEDLDQVGFETAPGDMFELVSGPRSPAPVTPCTPLELQLRFRAPLIPGAFAGQLGYSFGAGDGWVELYARAVPE